MNNAGVMEQVNMLAGDVDGAAITREIAINLTAPILLVRRCLPLLQHGRAPPAHRHGHLGLRLAPAPPTYSATKAGLRAFTQALRYQLQDSGIRVIETLPPLVDTPSTAGIDAWNRTSGSAAYNVSGNLSASYTRCVRTSWLRPAPGAVRHAPWSAERSNPISMKSLKCPACSDASCRLSVKESSFLARSASVASRRRWRIAARLRIVVAVLRPSEPREVSLAKSDA